MSEKVKVLFVCIHNSARSQIAEELLRKLAGDRFDAMSAGIEPGKINPLVAEILKEEGIDIAAKPTRSVAELIDQRRTFDYVITVCDEASAERCPAFPGKHRRLHWGFPDPSQFNGSKEERLEKIRAVKAAITSALRDWLKKDF